MKQPKNTPASGKRLPTEVKKATNEARTDPRLIVTTSQNPSSKLLQFTEEMGLILPNSHRINRGDYVVKELAETCRANDATALIVFHEHNGIPDTMIVSLFPHGPTAYFTLLDVVLRPETAPFEISTVSEQYPHSIFDGFTSKLGQRVKDILKQIFPVSKEESRRVMYFFNRKDYISFGNEVFPERGPWLGMTEVGPRFQMKAYEIRKGTIEQNEAEREWVIGRTGKSRITPPRYFGTGEHSTLYCKWYKIKYGWP